MSENTQDWDRDKQKVGIVVWISFLSAAIMSVVFFGLVDPDNLTHDVHWLSSRQAAYTMLFLFFWLGTFASGWFCVRLSRRKRQQPRPPGVEL